MRQLRKLLRSQN